jgi:hypothetical protein
VNKEPSSLLYIGNEAAKMILSGRKKGSLIIQRAVYSDTSREERSKIGRGDDLFMNPTREFS